MVASVEVLYWPLVEVHLLKPQPEGVPEENWLPINRQDEDLNIILRIYMPDLEKYKTCSVAKAEKVKQ